MHYIVTRVNEGELLTASLLHYMSAMSILHGTFISTSLTGQTTQITVLVLGGSG